jgi:hypothetical protein
MPGMSNAGAHETNERTAELTQGKAEPVTRVAPERKGRRDLTVERQPDETDADYEARRTFVTQLLDAVEKG